MSDEQQQLFDRISIQCPDIIALRKLALDFPDALAPSSRVNYANGLRGRNGANSAQWFGLPTACKKTSPPSRPL
jgi:hypothetical protein